MIAALALKYWYIGVFVVLLGIYYIQHEQLTIYKLKIDKYEQQFKELVAASKKSQSRADTANKEASEEIKNYKNDPNRINNEKVPKDCMGAMQWGVEQAKLIP